ncbi:CAP domain-containing protein [Oryzobacter sp. R7]|uniref:CAP domain-containing protein n=1 Tax=Oryzobacter faecalis TaxID=3388656 RepID=UPI00398CAFCD
MTPSPVPMTSRARLLAAAALAAAVLAATGATASPAGAAPARGTGDGPPRWAPSSTRLVGTTAVSPGGRVRVARTGDPVAAEVVRLVNVERAKVGCVALRSDSRLATAARLHSEDMARQDYFSHTSLDGRTWIQRIQAQGYTAGSGENIAAGYSTPAAVMTAWMNSSGHRANILNCASRAIGVGIGKGGTYGTYWTQDFGRT